MQHDTLLTADDLLSHPLIPFKSINTVKARVKDGTFPRPVSYGPRLKRWHKSDIDKWIEKQAAQRSA